MQCPAHQIKAMTKNKMLNLGNLSVNNVDLVMIGAYAALCFGNKKACVPLILAILYLLIHSLPFRSFHCYMLCVMMYFIVSVANIKIPLEIRRAFTCFGVIYLGMAIHNFVSYHFDSDTQMKPVLKSMIIVVNAYVISHLFGDWRRNNVDRFAHYCARVRRWYKMHPLRIHRLKEKT